MYYRYSNGDVISNYTGFGMFSDNESKVEGCYGSNKYTYDGSNGVSIFMIKNHFVGAWEECKDNAPDYLQHLTPEEFFQAFDPEDIVEDAEAWDNPDIRMFFNQFIYDDEPAILLTNGAIVFDEALTVAH